MFLCAVSACLSHNGINYFMWQRVFRQRPYFSGKFLFANISKLKHLGSNAAALKRNEIIFSDSGSVYMVEIKIAPVLFIQFASTEDVDFKFSREVIALHKHWCCGHMMNRLGVYLGQIEGFIIWRYETVNIVSGIRYITYVLSVRLFRITSSPRGPCN